MSLLGSHGVFMPSFMMIGLKMWTLQGCIQAHRRTQTDGQTDIQTDRKTDRQSFFYHIDIRQSRFWAMTNNTFVAFQRSTISYRRIIIAMMNGTPIFYHFCISYDRMSFEKKFGTKRLIVMLHLRFR